MFAAATGRIDAQPDAENVAGQFDDAAAIPETT